MEPKLISAVHTLNDRNHHNAMTFVKFLKLMKLNRLDLSGKPYLYSRRGIKMKLTPLLLIAVFAGQQLLAQDPDTQFKIFGHLTAAAEEVDGEYASNFSLGEQDLFVLSQITPRISLLGETVVGPNNVEGHGGSGFKISVERARLKYQHRNWLSVIVGKMHTPVNYWNDVYHHGRLFFPTIDRPKSFGLSIPIHSLGLRLQGQNIGGIGFGYDFVVANGMSANDVTDGSAQKSITAAVHIKPEERMRIGFSAYRDRIFSNMIGSHAGHSSKYHYAMGDPNFYALDLDFELYCFSFWRNKGKWETLIESTWNRTAISDTNDPDLTGGLDSLGTSNNYTMYLFASRKVTKRDGIYGLFDCSSYEEVDLHLKSHRQYKFGLGWSREFSPYIKSQIQIERYLGVDGYEVPADDAWELKFRLAYCIF